MAVRVLINVGSFILGNPPDCLCVKLVGDDGLEPPTLSV
jgi:hypothetical protein